MDENSDIIILNNNIDILNSEFMTDIELLNKFDKLDLKSYVDSQQKQKLENLNKISDFETIKTQNANELENLKNNNKIINELINNMTNDYNIIKNDIEYLSKTYSEIMSIFIEISKKIL